MRSRLTILALIATLIVSACDGATSVYLQTPEALATAKLGKVTHPKWNWGAAVDVVWGKLTIESMNRPLKSADLECFELRIGDSVSEHTYVASIASVSADDYPARNGVVTVPVYWIMKNFAGGTNADLPRAKLVYRPKASGSCFELT